MVRRTASRLAVALTAAAAMVAVAPTAALAAPTNDDYASATVINDLPYSTSDDTTEATWDPSDPQDCSSNASVWFAFTPSTDMTIQADTFGSNYDTVLSAWTGDQGSLSLVTCNDDASSAQSQITFAASAGTTYHFMVARCCYSGDNGGGSLQFSVTRIQPPTNDNFADAAAVGTLPFSDRRDLSTATSEPNEPTSCLGSAKTVWYAFTPTTTQSVTATVDQWGTGLAAYTGSSLTSLSQVSCENYYYQPLTFRAEAGRTYFFQVGAWCCSYSVPTTFHLDVAPNPTAYFYYYPSDPSSYDTVSFNDYSNDPAGVGITSRTWDFGDGTTSTLTWASHKFAADGDYTVKLTVTTADGRTGSTSQVVQVRTHDVAITRLAVPATAHVGQTVGISVYLQNTRYPENVRVTLSKSVPGGYTQVGSSTQLVQVKTGGQFTRFAFSYTITAEDLAVGKVTFRADAIIQGARDALPGDNELLSTPVNIV